VGGQATSTHIKEDTSTDKYNFIHSFLYNLCKCMCKLVTVPRLAADSWCGRCCSFIWTLVLLDDPAAFKQSFHTCICSVFTKTKFGWKEMAGWERKRSTVLAVVCLYCQGGA